MIEELKTISDRTGVKDSEQEDPVRAFLASFTASNIDSHVSNEAVKIRRGSQIKFPDAIILATARSNNAFLVTSNTRDFKEDSPEVRVPFVTVLKNSVS
jgi:predicted nucleic acid-binding protein